MDSDLGVKILSANTCSLVRASGSLLGGSVETVANISPALGFLIRKFLSASIAAFWAASTASLLRSFSRTINALSSIYFLAAINLSMLSLDALALAIACSISIALALRIAKSESCFFCLSRDNNESRSLSLRLNSSAILAFSAFLLAACSSLTLFLSLVPSFSADTDFSLGILVTRGAPFSSSSISLAILLKASLTVSLPDLRNVFFAID